MNFNWTKTLKQESGNELWLRLARTSIERENEDTLSSQFGKDRSDIISKLIVDNNLSLRRERCSDPFVIRFYSSFPATFAVINALLENVLHSVTTPTVHFAADVKILYLDVSQRLRQSRLTSIVVDKASPSLTYVPICSIESWLAFWDLNFSNKVENLLFEGNTLNKFSTSTDIVIIIDDFHRLHKSLVNSGGAHKRQHVNKLNGYTLGQFVEFQIENVLKPCLIKLGLSARTCVVFGNSTDTDTFREHDNTSWLDLKVDFNRLENEVTLKVEEENKYCLKVERSNGDVNVILHSELKKK